MHDRETRTLRDRFAYSDSAWDASQAGGDHEGSAALVAQTTKVATYPAKASTFYAVIPCDVDGQETEGAAATYVQRKDEDGNPAILFALNLGSVVPPEGTTVVCHGAGGRWCFDYSG